MRWRPRRRRGGGGCPQRAAPGRRRRRTSAAGGRGAVRAAAVRRERAADLFGSDTEPKTTVSHSGGFCNVVHLTPLSTMVLQEGVTLLYSLPTECQVPSRKL